MPTINGPGQVTSISGAPTWKTLDARQSELLKQLKEIPEYRDFIQDLRLSSGDNLRFLNYSSSNTPCLTVFLEKDDHSKGVPLKRGENSLDDNQLRKIFKDEKTHEIIRELCDIKTSPTPPTGPKRRPNVSSEPRNLSSSSSPAISESESEHLSLPPYKFFAKVLKRAEKRAAVTEERLLTALEQSEQRYADLCKRLIDKLPSHAMTAPQSSLQDRTVQPIIAYERRIQQLEETVDLLRETLAEPSSLEVKTPDKKRSEKMEQTKLTNQSNNTSLMTEESTSDDSKSSESEIPAPTLSPARKKPDSTADLTRSPMEEEKEGTLESTSNDVEAVESEDSAAIHPLPTSATDLSPHAKSLLAQNKIILDQAQAIHDLQILRLRDNYELESNKQKLEIKNLHRRLDERDVTGLDSSQNARECVDTPLSSSTDSKHENVSIVSPEKRVQKVVGQQEHFTVRTPPPIQMELAGSHSPISISNSSIDSPKGKEEAEDSLVSSLDKDAMLKRDLEELEQTLLFFNEPLSREDRLKKLEREWNDLGSPEKKQKEEKNFTTQVTRHRTGLSKLLESDQKRAEREIARLEDQLIEQTKEVTPTLAEGTPDTRIKKYARAIANAKEIQQVQDQVLAEIAKRAASRSSKAKVQELQEQRIADLRNSLHPANLSSAQLYEAVTHERKSLKKAKRELEQANEREHKLITGLSKLTPTAKRENLKYTQNPKLESSVNQCLADEPFNPEEMDRPAPWMLSSLQRQRIKSSTLTQEVEAQKRRVNDHNRQLQERLAKRERKKQEGYAAFEDLSQKQLTIKADEIYARLNEERERLNEAKNALEAARLEKRKLLSKISKTSMNPSSQSLIGQPSTIELEKTVIQYLSDTPSNPTDKALLPKDVRILQGQLELAVKFTTQVTSALQKAQENNEMLRGHLSQLERESQRRKPVTTSRTFGATNPTSIRKVLKESATAHSVAREALLESPDSRDSKTFSPFLSSLRSEKETPSFSPELSRIDEISSGEEEFKSKINGYDGFSLLP